MTPRDRPLRNELFFHKLDMLTPVPSVSAAASSLTVKAG
jgi:hypothetical protein